MQVYDPKSGDYVPMFERAFGAFKKPIVYFTVLLSSLMGPSTAYAESRLNPCKNQDLQDTCIQGMIALISSTRPYLIYRGEGRRRREVRERYRQERQPQRDCSVRIEHPVPRQDP